VAAVLALSLVSSFACLTSLPDATVCSGATQAFCDLRPPPGSVAREGGVGAEGGPPTMEGGACLFATEPCMSQRGTCACTQESECRRDTATCFPPPDCPSSVAQAKGGASCEGARIILRPEPHQCVCGCSSCAETCDGKGAIFGPNESFAVELPATLGERGSVGVMIRGRGAGAILIALGQQMGPVEAGAGMQPVPFGSAVFQGAEFEDLFGSSSTGVTYDWSDASHRPKTLQLTTDPFAYVEIDCIVPFVTP
jgi:hypothetical protein